VIIVIPLFDDIPLLPVGDGGVLGQFFVENTIPDLGEFKVANYDQHTITSPYFSLCPVQR
jgi:hypothetical protein